MLLLYGFKIIQVNSIITDTHILNLPLLLLQLYIILLCHDCSEHIFDLLCFPKHLYLSFAVLLL